MNIMVLHNQEKPLWSLKYTAVNTIPTKMRCAVNTGSVVGKSSSARPE